jgi:metal-responsive CopG/Arc/MetJ family transcriptional regulator
MQVVKIGISVEKKLFEEIDNYARAKKLTRSKFFSLTAQTFIEHQKNKEMFAQINDAYANEPDAVEQAILRKLRSQQRQIVKREW